MPVAAVNDWLVARGMPVLKDRVSAEGLLRRPEVNWAGLVELEAAEAGVDESIAEQVEIQVKYEGYIRRDLELLEGMRKNEMLRIPSHLDFSQVAGLSNEILSRLKATRPETIGQASRLPGVTPAAVASLLIHLKMQESRA
jgi:tRNA uridine 5-carboxymethylaminomethyl modification enzyme